jgi:hypothetical protein
MKQATVLSRLVARPEEIDWELATSGANCRWLLKWRVRTEPLPSHERPKNEG